jgi:hypothetical protein
MRTMALFLEHLSYILRFCTERSYDCVSQKSDPTSGIEKRLLSLQSLKKGPLVDWAGILEDVTGS